MSVVKLLVATLCAIVAYAAAAVAQPIVATPGPRIAPDGGYTFHDEVAVERFLVQRWVSEASPEVSPAGFCDCVTLVYEGTRLVLTVRNDGGTTVESGGDITGDGRPELVVSQYSGGAHCCESTAIYAVDSDEAAPRTLLSVDTGSCFGELVDYDKDGVPEFHACDDSLAYTFCAFAYSPLPAVVFAYDRQRGVFTLATPRFASYLPDPMGVPLADARKKMAENARTPELVRCAALGPALSLIYGGRVADGLALFARLYRRPDRASFERKVMAEVRKSPLWVER